MIIRSGRVCVCVCLALTWSAAARAQRSGGPPPDVLNRPQEAQPVSDLARELERVANQLARARADALAAQGGGGRGARSGGSAAPTTFDPSTNDPMAGPVVKDAPFSADAITTVTQVLGDGTRIDQRATAKFYRDSTGRIRREQTIVGMDWANPREPGEPITIITVDSEPGDQRPYQLDPAAKVARRVPRAAAPGNQLTVRNIVVQREVTVVDANGQTRTLPTRTLEPNPANIDMPVTFQGLTIPRRGIPPDLRPTEEQLGTRQMDGMKAVGRRTTVTIPTDRLGNDRPIAITDERWESPELGVVIYSRYSDPRTGVVEYRLASINRGEPRADLFTIPSDYSVVGAGQRTGGARQGGGGGGGARGRGGVQ